jgi:hypothetical protein
MPLSHPLPNCGPCTTAAATLKKDYRLFTSQVKLPAIDYYSGGGGGMIGAEGFFQHTHAVEMDKTACDTLR